MDKRIFLIAVLFYLGGLSGLYAKIDTLTADLDEPVETDNIQGWASLGNAIGWDVEASSHLPSQKDNHYDVSKLDDGLIKTAWVEGKEGYGIGEYVIFRFTPSKFYIPDSINLWAFYLINGYCKDEATWKANSRVKTIKMYHNDKAMYVVKLHDSMNLQSFGFEVIWLKPGDEIKIEILDVYPGTKYKDTAVTELLPMGAL